MAKVRINFEKAFFIRFWLFSGFICLLLELPTSGKHEKHLLAVSRSFEKAKKSPQRFSA